MMGPVGFIWNALTGPVRADKIDTKKVGDKVVKTYVYRRLKIPFVVDRALIKVAEGITPPLRNPMAIEVSEPGKLEEGLITEDVRVDVTLPAIGLITTERVKRKIRGSRKRRIPIR